MGGCGETRFVRRMGTCASSFLHFLSYCKLIVPPSPNEAGFRGSDTVSHCGPHIKEIVKAFLSQRLIVILKSRQIGRQWICAAYDLWFALFMRGRCDVIF